MEKQDLIDRLKKNKEKSKQFNFFGDDCHLQLDRRIEVLEENLTRDEAVERFEDDDMNDIFDVLEGETEVDDILYPEIY